MRVYNITIYDIPIEGGLSFGIEGRCPFSPLRIEKHLLLHQPFIVVLMDRSIASDIDLNLLSIDPYTVSVANGSSNDGPTALPLAPASSSFSLFLPHLKVNTLISS